MTGDGFQSRSSEQGRLFEQQCVVVLAAVGFEVRRDPGELYFPNLGIRLDAIADNRRAVSFFCEFKGSWMGPRPGVQRTDTVKKALMSAYSLHAEGIRYPFLLLSSHDPPPDHSCAAMIAAAIRHQVLCACVNINSPAGIDQLQALAGAEMPLGTFRVVREDPAPVPAIFKLNP